MNTEEYLQEILREHPEYAEAPFFLGVPFTDEDRHMISGVLAIVPFISDFLGKHYEVLVHSLEDPLHSIIYAANASLSMRKEGDPIYKFGFLRILSAMGEKKGVQYFGKGCSGHKVRAGAYPIMNKNGRCIGSLSLGFDLEAPLISLLQDFYTGKESLDRSEIFGPRINVEETVQEVLEQVRKNSAVKRRTRTKEVIRILVDKKVFEMRNAVNIVANLLGSSPATVYWHLRELKQLSGETREKSPGTFDKNRLW